jgi:hypothetical protein
MKYLYINMAALRTASGPTVILLLPLELPSIDAIR